MAQAGLITALGVSLVVCAVAIRLGPRMGILDAPDEELKTHTYPVVPLGGAGVVLGLHVGLSVAGLFDTALFASTLVVWILGLVDDLRGLSPRTRLLGTTVAGLLLALMSDLPGGAPAVLLWAGATVVVVNAMNLLDGLDGLAASVALASLGALWWFGVAQDAVGPGISVVSMGAILGFLYWNIHPAKIFLGDNGAYVIGVILTWAALRASPDGAAALVGLALIGVPVLDMAVTVVRRLILRRGLLSGDRDHSYDRLVQAGTTNGKIVLYYVAVELVWASIILLIAISGSDLGAALTAGVLGSAVVLTMAVRQASGRVV